MYGTNDDGEEGAPKFRSVESCTKVSLITFSTLMVFYFNHDWFLGHRQFVCRIVWQTSLYRH